MSESSLSNSSELGAWRRLTRFKCGYSRPMMGVASICSCWSNAPVAFTHGFADEVVAEACFPGRMGMVVWASTSVAEGAIVPLFSVGFLEECCEDEQSVVSSSERVSWRSW